MVLEYLYFPTIMAYSAAMTMIIILAMWAFWHGQIYFDFHDYKRYNLYYL